MAERESRELRNNRWYGGAGRRDLPVSSSQNADTRVTLSTFIDALENGMRVDNRTDTPGGVTALSAIFHLGIAYQLRTGLSSFINNLLKKFHAGGAPLMSRTVSVPFLIDRLVINPVQALQGSTVNISFQASNTSGLYSIYPVTLKVNNQVIAGEVISVPPKCGLPMNFIIPDAMPGVYEVNVNNVSGKFVVKAGEPENVTTVKFQLPDDVLIPDLQHDQRVESTDLTAGHVQSEPRTIAPAASGAQHVVDTLADYIELSLDKLGDALIYPINKLIDLLKRNP